MMTNRTITIDTTKSLEAEPGSGHNRWHEAIPPIAEVRSGETIVVETRDALDGQLDRASTVETLSTLNLNRMHPLTGPISIEGAQPGDILIVDVHRIDPDPWERYAVSVVAPGFGALPEDFEEPFVVHWNLRDGGSYAESDQLPGIRIPAGPFLGVLGVAPSQEGRQVILEDENDFVQKGWTLPQPHLMNAMPNLEAVGSGGLRTLPPRQLVGGGNMDIRQATPGVRYLIPIRTPGGLLSVGDAHFAQGDGEICGTGLEMRARTTLSCSLRKDAAHGSMGDQVRLTRANHYADPDYSLPKRLYATTGISHDLAEAARDAVRNMLDHLETRGYTRLQAYAICSAAVSLRVTQLVDAPMKTVAAVLPLDIFFE